MAQVSLFAGAVALPGEFGTGLRLVGWRGSLPLCGAVAAHAVLVRSGGPGWEHGAGCL